MTLPRLMSYGGECPIQSLWHHGQHGRGTQHRDACCCHSSPLPAATPLNFLLYDSISLRDAVPLLEPRDSAPQFCALALQEKHPLLTRAGGIRAGCRRQILGVLLFPAPVLWAGSLAWGRTLTPGGTSSAEIALGFSPATRGCGQSLSPLCPSHPS